MPIFGDFETIGEPVAVTEYRHHTTTVWRARKAGSGTEATFAIKCFVPHPTVGKEESDEEKLERNQALEFLEGIKQLKKAHAEGGRNLCPVHAFGYADEGTWYATDFYPRNTLKAWISRRGSMDDAALAQVVRCVCAAALALKRSRGYSHGNLKPSNIFLVGKPRPLRQTPLALGDVYPSGAAPLARLEDAANREAKELLGSVMEVQDLRALGELLLQLVEGRLVSSAYDYNYPIAASPAWERLGRHAERWRELCNRLLDPQLSLTKINFESLTREFRPSAVAGKLPLIAGAIGVIVLIASGAVYFATRPRQPTTATPVTIPAGGSFTESVAVTLTTPMAEATVYYTLDGSEPTTNSTVYSQVLVLNESRTVSARAFARDHKPSKTVKARYEVTPAPVVAPPTLAPAPGMFPDSVTVTLASATPGATIYYTTNNAEPTPSAMRYVGPITLTSSAVVKARAIASGQKDSEIVSGRFEVTMTPEAVRPTIRPDGGGHRDLVSVELSTPTTGATIYYTTDGREPTLQSPRYTRAFTLTTNATVKARAVASNHKDSPTASATFYVSSVPVVAAPVLVPAGGMHKDSVTISLTSPTPGAVIRYTINNADPTASAARYVGPFALTNSATVKARAFANDQKDSAITSAEFVVTATPVAGQPVFKPDGGTHRDSVTVELSTTTPGANIYYTTDGREPTAQSLRYARALILTNSTTIKARAVANDFKDSPTASATFNVAAIQIAGAPTIAPMGGDHRDEVTVSLTSPTPGAVIYYTTNGDEPTTGATRYNASFKLTRSSIVRARAFAPNYEPSATTQAEFKVTPTPIVAAPVIGPAQRNHADSVTVTMESSTEGAMIYYTLDGREPTTGSPRYQQPITLTETRTVKARAVARDHRDSPVVSADFTVRITPVATAPEFSPRGGTYADLVVVRLQSSTSRAGIYFTLDGADLSTNSARYEQPLALTQSTTIKALAWGEGYKPSAAVSAVFTVTNTPLIAMAPELVSTFSGQETNIVLAGTGPRGSPLGFEIKEKPARGSLALVATNVVRYAAPQKFTGKESFTFVVRLGSKESAPARVNINVTSDFDRYLGLAEAALAASDLLPADKNIKEAAKYATTREEDQGVHEYQMEKLAGLNQQLKAKVNEVIRQAESHRTEADYAQAKKVYSRYAGIPEFDQRLGQLVEEEKTWRVVTNKYAAAEYEFFVNDGNNEFPRSKYAEVMPFQKILADANKERELWQGLQQKTSTTLNWKVVRDELDKLKPPIRAKTPFKKIADWVAQNDPVGALQLQLEVYKVWFKAGDYRKDLTYQGQKVSPLQGNIDKKYQEACSNQVYMIKLSFKDAGMLTSERERDLDALKQAIDNWNR